MLHPTITRRNQRPDVIYVGDCPDLGGEVVFVSPDGEGRFYYDSVEEAVGQHGELHVVRVQHIEE